MSTLIADWATLAAVVVGAIGLFLAARQLRLQNDQLRYQNRQRLLELGNFYIARYWEIDDDLLLTPKSDEKHRGHRHRYLRLCEDEYDAAREGWLDLEQWNVWHEGLITDRSRRLLTADLIECDPDAEAFVSLRTCLAQTERQEGPHSVEACSSMVMGTVQIPRSRVGVRAASSKSASLSTTVGSPRSS